MAFNGNVTTDVTKKNEIKKGEMRLLTHFPSYFLIYDCLCPHPFHETKKDYRLLPLSALPPCPDGCPPAHDLPFRLRKEVRNNDVLFYLFSLNEFSMLVISSMKSLSVVMRWLTLVQLWITVEWSLPPSSLPILDAGILVYFCARYIDT